MNKNQKDKNNKYLLILPCSKQKKELYAAIRVPQAANPRLLKHANLNGFSIDDLVKMEKDALQALNKFDKGKIDADKALNIILKYDALLLRGSNDGENLKERYERTLLDKPWKSCNCNVCKKLGIHVIIFRGTNRNKRRGFHNTWIFREIADNINIDMSEDNANIYNWKISTTADTCR